MADSSINFSKTEEYAEAKKVAIAFLENEEGAESSFSLYLKSSVEFDESVGNYLAETRRLSKYPLWLQLLRYVRFEVYNKKPVQLKAGYDQSVALKRFGRQDNITEKFEVPAESARSKALRMTNERLSERRLFCPVCGSFDLKTDNVLETTESIINHFLTHHGQLDLFACHFCFRSYTTKEELIAHNCTDYQMYYDQHSLASGYKHDMKFAICLFLCVDCGRRYRLGTGLTGYALTRQKVEILEFFKIHSPTHIVLGLIYSEEILCQTAELKICMKTAFATDLRYDCSACGFSSFSSPEQRNKHFSRCHNVENMEKCPSEECIEVHDHSIEMKKHVLENHIFNGLIAFFMNNYAAMKVRKVGLMKPKGVLRRRKNLKESEKEKEREILELEKNVLIGGIAPWDEDDYIPIENAPRTNSSSSNTVKFDENMLRRIGRADLIPKFDFKNEDKNLRMSTKLFNADGTTGTLNDFEGMEFMVGGPMADDCYIGKDIVDACSIEVPFDIDTSPTENLKKIHNVIKYCKMCHVLMNGEKEIQSHLRKCELKKDEQLFDLFYNEYSRYQNRMLGCPFCSDWLCSIDGWIFHFYNKHGILVKYMEDETEPIAPVKISKERSAQIDLMIENLGRDSEHPFGVEVNIEDFSESLESAADSREPVDGNDAEDADPDITQRNESPDLIIVLDEESDEPKTSRSLRSGNHRVREETAKADAQAAPNCAVADGGDVEIVVTKMIRTQQREAPVVKEDVIADGDEECMVVAEVMKQDHGFKTKSKRAATRKCPKCSNSYLTEQSLESHLLKDHQNDFNDMYAEDYGLPIEEEFYVCVFCTTAFENHQKFLNHSRMHGSKKNENILCTQCAGYTISKSESNQHEWKHNEKQLNWVCTECRPCRIMKTEGELLFHQKDAHGVQMVWFCKNCFKGKCKPDDNFAHHIRICNQQNNPIQERLGIVSATTLTYQPEDEQKYLEFAKANPKLIAPLSVCSSRSLIRGHTGAYSCFEMQKNEKQMCHVLTQCTFAHENGAFVINNPHFLNERRGEQYIDDQVHCLYSEFIEKNMRGDATFGKWQLRQMQDAHQRKRKAVQPERMIVEAPVLMPVQQMPHEMVTVVQHAQQYQQQMSQQVQQQFVRPEFVGMPMGSPGPRGPHHYHPGPRPYIFPQNFQPPMQTGLQQHQHVQQSFQQRFVPHSPLLSLLQSPQQRFVPQSPHQTTGLPQQIFLRVIPPHGYPGPQQHHQQPALQSSQDRPGPSRTPQQYRSVPQNVQAIDEELQQRAKSSQSASAVAQPPPPKQQRPQVEEELCVICGALRQKSTYRKDTLMQIDFVPPESWIRRFSQQLNELPQNNRVVEYSIAKEVVRGKYMCVRHFNPFAYCTSSEQIQMISAIRNEPFLNFKSMANALIPQFRKRFELFLKFLDDANVPFEKVRRAHEDLKKVTICAQKSCKKVVESSLLTYLHSLHDEGFAITCGFCYETLRSESRSDLERIVFQHLDDYHGILDENRVRYFLKCQEHQSLNFESLFDFQVHIAENHREDRNLRMSICGSLMENDMKRVIHDNEHKEAQHMQCCVICRKVCHDTSTLESQSYSHEFIHTARFRFICNCCGFVSNDQEDLASTHFEERHKNGRKCRICRVPAACDHFYKHIHTVFVPNSTNGPNGQQLWIRNSYTEDADVFN